VDAVTETLWTKSHIGRKADVLVNVMVHVCLGVIEVLLSRAVYNAALN
jgi:hypothetical protein